MKEINTFQVINSINGFMKPIQCSHMVISRMDKIAADLDFLHYDLITDITEETIKNYLTIINERN